MYKCENCGEEFSEKYLRLCNNCITIIDENKLKELIRRNIKSAEYFKRYNYHKRLELSDYDKYIQRADRYTKALVNKLGLTKTTE